MNIEKLETDIHMVEQNVVKIRELASDLKVCGSGITKALIQSAIKKYAGEIGNFKLED